jgi:ATP-dependent RNA helicase SUPV3L1/SUV3
LFRLAAAEDVTGMARGLAYQLIEGMGVLERQKVADEVKGLDQPARATLRKYGVRFGAYHIYLPNLLKPGARVLATQLWALKWASPETKDLPSVEQAAGSGRTSIAVEKDALKPLYRVAGYRVCGERAVRIDILERLADLIRTSLAWRPGTPGEKPVGAIEGFGFTVAPAMTSLAGCSGEDFASVLRSLGYRMEKRPKPAEPAPPAQTSEQSESSEQAAASSAEQPENVLRGGNSETPPSGEAEVAAASPAVAEPAVAEFTEIWRPGHRRATDHGVKRRRALPASDAKSSETGAPADVQAGVAPLVPGQEAVAPKRRQHRSRRKSNQEAGTHDAEQQQSTRGAAPRRRARREESGDTGAHSIPQRSRDRAERGRKGERPDRDPALRAKYMKGRGEQKTSQQPDPDSPFAKLAELKEKLEAGPKEQG